MVICSSKNIPMDHNNLPYQVVRSKRRKTAQIRVRPEKVEIRIPDWLSDQWVEKWISERGDWIQKKWNEINLSSAAFKLSFHRGAELPYLGRNYRLEWAVGKTAYVELDDDRICVSISQRSKKTEAERVKAVLEDWYKQQAHQFLTERLHYWQSEMGLYSHSIKTKGYKRRWGSCSASGHISFNWKLIFATEPLIDYVVIHEIAHLKHMNHSPVFWKLVENYCPEWKKHRKALNQRAPWLEW